METQFYGYTSGIYECEEADGGGHAVIMVGWGEEDGVKYGILKS